MKKLLGSLFGNTGTASPARSQPHPEPQEHPVEHYLAHAMRRSRALTPRGESAIAEYLAQFGQVPGIPLEASRMQGKGAADVALNIRAAELLRTPLSPRRPLTALADELLRSAILQKARYEAVVRMREFCAEMSLVLGNTGDECDWCRANEGNRFPVTDDPNELLDRHCSCAPFSSATFYPAIEALNP